jgi:hypothetical protein
MKRDTNRHSVAGIRRWQQRFGQRTGLKVRLASADSLHRRRFLDDTRAWVLGAPFSELAKGRHTVECGRRMKLARSQCIRRSGMRPTVGRTQTDPPDAPLGAPSAAVAAVPAEAV